MIKTLISKVVEELCTVYYIEHAMNEKDHNPTVKPSKQIEFMATRAQC